MTRLRGVVFFALIGVVTALALLSRLPADSPLSSDTIPLAAFETSSASPIPERQLEVTPAIVDNPEATSLPLPTLSVTSPAEPTPVPPVVEAAALLGQPPDSSGENPASLPATPAAEGWSPPSLPVPLARHPYDHYWFIRPVTSAHVNSGLIRYPYGSTGTNKDLRIHHGIDIANPVGVEVLAVADGTVVWSGRGHHNQYESITAFGNTVVVQHNLGYRGKAVYTLYAHLSAILVEPGEQISAGQLIGLIGATGQVSGPHVHFEVRVDRNSYYAVRNPDLWLAPYAGTGVIAGRVEFPDGRPADELEVRLVSRNTGRTTHRTLTYAGFGVNSDDLWNENFTIPDVPVGQYLLTSHFGAIRWSGEIEVREGMTNWVEMEVRGAGSSP